MNNLFLNNPIISVAFFDLGKDSFKLIAYNNENVELGNLTIINANNSINIYAYVVWVNEKFRRIGIATLLYDYAEKYFNKKILPYEYLNPDYESSCDAIEFWRNRGLNLNDRYRLFD